MVSSGRIVEHWHCPVVSDNACQLHGALSGEIQLYKIYDCEIGFAEIWLLLNKFYKLSRPSYIAGKLIHGIYVTRIQRAAAQKDKIEPLDRDDYFCRERAFLVKFPGFAVVARRATARADALS
jgi:hypothetical protein